MKWVSRFPMSDQKIQIEYTHFEWLNHELLRLGELARSYSDRGDRLQKENKELKRRIAQLEDAITSGGAVIPDATPIE